MSYFYDDNDDEEDQIDGQQEQENQSSSSSSRDTLDDLKKAREKIEQNRGTNNSGGNTGGQGGGSPSAGSGTPGTSPGGTSSVGATSPGTAGTTGTASTAGTTGTAGTGATTTGAATTAGGATTGGAATTAGGAATTGAGATAAGGAATTGAGATAAGGAAATGAGATAAGGAAATGAGAAAAGGAAAGGAATAGVAAGAAVAWPILLVVLIIVLIIIIVICVIGIIIFIQTMPGAALEKITTLARKTGNAFASWWGVDSTTQVSDQDIYDVMDYLEEMGYDLKGYGFLTDYVDDENDAEDDGVKRHESGDNEGKISEATSVFINQYIVSDNYVYTIANDNVATGTGTGNIFTNAWGAIKAFGSHVFGSWSSKMGSREGMLQLYHDTGTIGERGGKYKAIERGYIKADAEKQTLTIKKGWTNEPMEYSLDGWTGRYGMPLEFLLSIHMATMMPDLAYDIATTFEPKVIILLHEQNGRRD